jgi:hypothetical protein
MGKQAAHPLDAMITQGARGAGKAPDLSGRSSRCCMVTKDSCLW